MQRIGLTGGIGSGKSTALQVLAALGAAVVDADAISREVTAPGGAAIPGIGRQFGADFITSDGALDRARMRELAYARPAARKELEAIIHPLVAAGIQEQVARAVARGGSCIVFDIPLLVESGRWRREVDRVFVIDCNPQTQVQRVAARSGLTPDAVQGIMAAQAPRATRLAAADIVVCNESLSLAQFEAEVRQAAATFGL
jgi:dephospho-CoA kinase